MNYRKKPIVIQAIRFDNYSSFEDMIRNWGAEFVAVARHIPDIALPKIAIETLEGVMNASLGDYVIRGIKGEFYPCKPDVFEQTYEVADEGGFVY